MKNVFISYYHDDAQSYKDDIVAANNKYCIFNDVSVDTGDIDDSKLTDEQIRIIIRDNYIKDADVFILLCGKNSKHRKHIDWEIHAAMYKSNIKNPIPILVINLPDCRNGCRKTNDREKAIIEKGQRLNWFTLNSYAEYKQSYPDLPERLLKSLANKQSPIAIVNYEKLTVGELSDLIEMSFQRKYEYDDSDPLRRKNGEDE